jgi:hypothetical protein
MAILWSASAEWTGEAGFVIAGGPSVLQQPVPLLTGRRVVAINSSWEIFPTADILLFADHRWWIENRRRLSGFKGRIVTVSELSADPRLLHLRKAQPPPALTARRDSLAMTRTTLQAAINLLVHFGCIRIVLLGADMRAGADGRTHHHRPHPWASKPGCWAVQMEGLQQVVPLLAAKGIEVFNASPCSAIEWWPKKPLTECLA